MLGAYYQEFLQKFEPFYESAIHEIELESQKISFSENVTSLFLNPLERFAKGGKRIRPYLVAVGSGNLDQQSLEVGVGVELVHVFALIHDDIMDHATKRRGMPTVHTSFSTVIRENTAAAMLLGDFIHAYANEYVATREPSAMRLFGEMQRFLCMGQFFEVYHWDKHVNKNISEKISLFKSAQYTFMYPLQLGFLIAGKPVSMLDTFSYFAGLSFQIRDDWLDIADNVETGKDKHIDGKNGVPNLVQIQLKENNYNGDKTYEDLNTLLIEYRKKAEEELQNVSLTPVQKESLHNILMFSTTLS